MEPHPQPLYQLQAETFFSEHAQIGELAGNTELAMCETCCKLGGYKMEI